MGQLQTATNPSQTLANGIATAEGYNVPGSIPDIANNPGDLKIGDVGYGTQPNGITNFADPEAGFAALNHQVQLIQSGNSTVGYTPDMSINEVAQLYTGGDNPTGWADTVAKAAGTTPTSNFAQVAQGVVDPTQTPPVDQTDPTNQIPPANTSSMANSDLDAVNFVPVSGRDISDADVDALSPNYVLTDNNGMPSGLDGPAWYMDDELVTGHEHLDAAVSAPITFEIMLPGGVDSNSNNYMTDSNGNTVVIELNVSARSLNLQEKHIFHRTPSRTGIHLTFWGMQPDIIVGEGSTGGFFNQFGLSSFMSTANFDSTLRTQILAILSQSQKQLPPAEYTVQDSTGEIFEAEPPNTPNDLQMAQQGLTMEALRVAAQDAFQEFLMLFKQNGVVYFHPNTYPGFQSTTPGSTTATAGSTTPNSQSINLQQQSPTAWSPQNGTSSFQGNARNNDVMARGHVVMKFKNSMYQGYFKSLSWTQDAEKPFQWTFNFTFQVERTISLVSFPFAQIAQPTVVQ